MHISSAHVHLPLHYPLSPAVLTGAMAAPRPKSADKFQPTEPKPFSFAVDKRAESRRGRASVADGAGEGLQRSGAGGFGEAGGPQTRLRAGQMAGGRSILDGGVSCLGCQAKGGMRWHQEGRCCRAD